MVGRAGVRAGIRGWELIVTENGSASHMNGHQVAAPLIRIAPELRETMRQFATGITVLTTGGDSIHGMTANAFSSVSLDPPLVLCCVARTAIMHAAITTARNFAVSILGAEQEHLARYFTNRQRPRGRAQFDTVRWRPGPHTGAPLLADSLAWLECQVLHGYDGGDHTIFVGEVLGAGSVSGRTPLLFFGGGYHQVASRVTEEMHRC